MDIQQYLQIIQKIHATGEATELSYRSALEGLLSSIGDGITALHEPRRVNCGAPDFVINRGVITLGHCEAKDIGIDVNPRALKQRNKDQFERYRKALPNLIYTNAVDFRFYRNGEPAGEVSIADFLMGLQPKPENFPALENLLKAFAAERLQTITSAKKLAEMMAGKAALIKDILSNALKEDRDLQTELTGQFNAFKEQLIHDLTPDYFADIYAETIAYGMFAARLHDTTLETFSRTEALDLLPKTNPFLRNLFQYIAGPNLDDRFRWIIDELAEVFQATDLQKLFADFGRFTQRNDPFIHFYETFLAEYNPAKRKARGVWYTPEPVVNFIVRAVDDVLKTEFGLSDGLADTSKVTIDWDTGQTVMRGKKAVPVVTKKEVHRVQILDPAAGTGTFLAEVIKQIAPKVKDVAEGAWSSYVENDLIPRLHGFELLMASYAMCHMKLDMMLTELGYKPSGAPPRLSVYLTNSLEEGEAINQTLPFAQWLSNEVKQANAIKRDMPIMVVLGNPPYSGESANKGDWIMGLMEAYKKEPGGKERLKERNPKWINDDYAKFIRLAEHMIEKNGEGVLGFITNHGYLDNPTFRGMRWHLLKTFDKIYVLDLHGNAKRKERAPDGSPDKNVFDIQQGVSIIVAVKRFNEAGEKPLAEVRHADLWGDRKDKYSALWDGAVETEFWTPLENRASQFPFVPRDNALAGAYQDGFGVQELMPVNSVGIVTARDALTIDMDKDALWQRVQDFASLEPEAAREKYQLGADVRDWTVRWAQEDVRANISLDRIVPLAYRPFDIRWTFYTGNSRGFICYPRDEIMRHYQQSNLGLLAPIGVKDRQFHHTFVTATSSEVIFLSGTTASNAKNFPLYLYPEEQDLDQSRRVNFDSKIFEALQELTAHHTHGTSNEVQIFDYIYGILHCTAYRETYAEFLKIDFPRIPWPPSPDVFWDVSAKGTELRRLHLMEDAVIGETPYLFRGEGENAVGKVIYAPVTEEAGSVFVNETQHFEHVPRISWEFWIGGYQPAQKWLKDRKGRTLSFADIRHYQKIVKILAETDRIMKTIEFPLN